MARYESRQRIKTSSIILYLAEVAYTDHLLGQFFNQVTSSGFLNDPLVILISDHGEAFCEHGVFKHGRTLYEEMIHVPFLLRFPGNEYAGTRIEDRVSLIDVIPTLFEILEMDPGDVWQGVSLFPLVKGDADGLDRPIYSEMSRLPLHYSAIYRKAMKFIESRREPVREDPLYRVTKLEAFDLDADPIEKDNLASKIPEEITRELQAMGKVLNGMLVERLKDGDIPAADLDPETVRGLQAHGYWGRTGQSRPLVYG